jgi:hypothetical protein
MITRRLRRSRLWVEELEGRLVPAVLAFSQNWSGYAIASHAGAISYVSGAWTVPAVTQTGYSASWVGIDGLNSRTVEQIGTESDYIGGQAAYYAWYQMYPNPAVQINQAVQPGDAIVASVSYSAGTGFTLTINASSWSSPFSQTVQATAPRSSAEWVVEAPSIDGRIQTLANFGSETFTGATATVGGTTGSIKQAAAKAPVAQIDMVTNRGTLKDTTSALAPAGTGFTVTFNAAGTRTPTTGHGSSSHDTNAPVTTLIVLVSSPTPTMTRLLVNQAIPPQQPLLPPLLPVTIVAPPSLPPLVLMDPYVGTPGVSDALGGGAGPGGVMPAGPAVPDAPNAPVLPAAPQLRPDGIATPPATSMVLPEGNEGAAMVQDEAVTHEMSDGTERTVEVAGIVLTLALSGSAGVSIGERTAKVKPGDADSIPLQVR